MSKIAFIAAVLVLCFAVSAPAAPPDKPPVADAGPDQLVHDSDLTGSETVTLDGSGSSSKKSVIVSWEWKEGATPIATGETAQVSLDVGVHTITLIVTDANAMTDDDTCVVEVNAPPSADAGSDQQVTDSDSSGSETVTLDGSASSDTDGTIQSWIWKEGANQIATGETAQVDLAVGQHTITLEVTDDDGATDDDTCVVTVDPAANQPPVADAGSDQQVTDTDDDGSETVTLDGSASSDPDGTIASWVWKEGVTEIATGETAQVTLDVGVHTITLVVTDNQGATDDDTCLVTVDPAPGGATLTYAYGATNPTYQYRPLIITASEGATDIWEMWLWVPPEGQSQTGHAVAPAGEIAVFKDLLYGGTPFNYSPEGTSHSWSSGLMRMSGFQGDYDDASGQASGYYEFTKTYEIQAGITGQLTVRINAPEVAGSDYQTTVEGSYTITNTSGSSYDLWFSGDTAGTGLLATEDAGYTSWAFVNPDDSTDKPNVHNTDVTDGHQLYTVYDWYGSTVIGDIKGFYARQEVKDNAETAALNMRPGMTFELRADDMDFYYVDLSNTMKGSTSVSTTNGVLCSLSNQPGVFGNGATLPDGQSVTLYWDGAISTTPLAMTPIADAGPDQQVDDNDSNGYETVTLDGSGSYDPGGTIVSWVWKEGLTQIATGETAQVDLDVGQHTITLVVTDDEANTDDDTCVVTVNVAANQPPVADAGSDQVVTDADSNGSETVTLDGSGSSDSDGTIVSWVWKEGETQIATGQTAQATLSVGVHTITLVVTDDDTATDDDTVQVTVNAPPVADAGSDQVITDADSSGSETVTLDGSGSSDSDGTIVSWVWKEGETQIATGQTAQATLSVGVHTITLVVTDDDAATDDDTVQVTVNVPPVADAGSDQLVHDTNASGSETVTLDGTGSSDADGTIVSYIWKEGITQIATGATAQVDLAVGQHVITLLVTDDDGGTDSDTANVEVNAVPVAAAGDDQEVTDGDGGGDETVTLDGSASSDSDGSIVTWVWKEGITEIATGETAQVVLTVGEHTITLVVTDDDGATHTDEVIVTVNAQSQATLSYAYGTTNPTYHYRPLIITASHDTEDVWEMQVWVPEAGYSQTGHAYWSAGEIASFKDLQFGGTAFEYSPEVGSSTSHGLMRMSGFDGDYDDTGGQQSSYYQFSKTYEIQTGITAVLTVRINAPIVDTGDFQSVVSGTYTITNTSGSSYDLWYTGSTAGCGTLGVEDGGYADWSIVNPNDATGKPNPHVTDVTDGHQLYELYDWYGSTVTSAIPGFYTKAVVKDNSQTQALNMRPGLTFELRCDDMDFYYVDLSNTMKGSTTVTTTAGVKMAISYQAGVFGNGVVLPDGESATLNWEGIISTWPTPIPPVAKAGDDFEVIDTDGGGDETVTLDGSASFDPDGSIVSYVWKEGQTQIATGETAQVTLDVGLHYITLVVTDNDGATDDDDIEVSIRGKDGYTYYVDFDGGNDDADGRSTGTPWKHCPGDTNATGIAAGTNLEPGDKVIFKGGVVYRGEINCYWSGLANVPIRYDGNTESTFGTGRAIVDGSEVLTGWTQCQSAAECDGNPNYASIYWTYAPAGVTTYSANLYEDDQLVWVAQDPNQPDPFWFDDIDNYLTFDSATDTTIVDADYFTMPGSDYWDGYTYIIIWAGANEVFPKRVTGYDQATHTISYESLGVSHYSPGKYAMSNSLKILDTAGEYVVREDQTGPGGGPKIYLWPLTSGVAGKTFTVSVRQNCFELQDESYISIRGFRIQKAGSGLGGSGGAGSAIRNSGGTRYDITIQDNELTMNKSMEKQPVINLSGITDCLVDANHVWENVRSRGMILSGCTYASIRNNLVQKNGGTAIDYYGSFSSDITDNVVLESFGVHANGITVYLGSDDIFIGGNTVLQSNIAFTCQDSDNLTLAYNVFETDTAVYCVAAWNDCDTVEFYNNVIMHTGTPGSGLSIGSTNNTNFVLKNNIIDGTNALYAGHTCEYNIYTSLMWCQDPENLGTGEFEANKNDLFVDHPNDDFHLKSGCDAIDAGVDLGFTLDKDGNTVPQGDAPDIGAYEYPQP